MRFVTTPTTIVAAEATVPGLGLSRRSRESADGVDGMLTALARIKSLLGVWIRREGGTSSRYSERRRRYVPPPVAIFENEAGTYYRT